MEHKNNKAFTLIELLVVISIIALLVSILMPALNKARMQATSAVCLSNIKQLSTGWFMYAMENEDTIPKANFDYRGATDYKGSWISWARDENGNYMSPTQTSPIVEDADEIRGIRAGSLIKYIDAPEAYHCPGERLSKRKGPDGSGVFVSYVVPDCLNGVYNQYIQITKLTKIKTPAEKYNFVESAEERNYNAEGHFVLGSPDLPQTNGIWHWWGPMAVNHGRRSNLGFCDGHAESKQWNNQYTIDRVKKLSAGGVGAYGLDLPEGGTEDIEYMARGWPAKQASYVFQAK